MHNRKYLHTTASIYTRVRAPSHTTASACAHEYGRLRTQPRAPTHTTASFYTRNRERLRTQPRATANSHVHSRRHLCALLYTLIYTLVCAFVRTLNLYILILMFCRTSAHSTLHARPNTHLYYIMQTHVLSLIF